MKPFVESSRPRSFPEFGSGKDGLSAVKGFGRLPNDVLERWVQLGQKRAGIRPERRKSRNILERHMNFADLFYRKHSSDDGQVMPALYMQHNARNHAVRDLPVGV